MSISSPTQGWVFHERLGVVNSFIIVISDDNSEALLREKLANYYTIIDDKKYSMYDEVSTVEKTLTGQGYVLEYSVACDLHGGECSHVKSLYSFNHETVWLVETGLTYLDGFKGFSIVGAQYVHDQASIVWSDAPVKVKWFRSKKRLFSKLLPNGSKTLRANVDDSDWVYKQLGGFPVEFFRKRFYDSIGKSYYRKVKKGVI